MLPHALLVNDVLDRWLFAKIVQFLCELLLIKAHDVELIIIPLEIIVVEVAAANIGYVADLLVDRLLQAHDHLVFVRNCPDALQGFAATIRRHRQHSLDLLDLLPVHGLFLELCVSVRKITLLRRIFLKYLRHVFLDSETVIAFVIQSSHLHQILVEVKGGRRLLQLFFNALVDGRRLHDVVQLILHIVEVFDSFDGRVLNLVALDTDIVHAQRVGKAIARNVFSAQGLLQITQLLCLELIMLPDLLVYLFARVLNDFVVQFGALVFKLVGPSAQSILQLLHMLGKIADRRSGLLFRLMINLLVSF
jgi:hypothetical protein